MSQVNQKVEMMVIGNLILDSELEINGLQSDYFAFEETRKLFDTLVKLKDEEKPTFDVFIECPELMDFITKCNDYGIITANYKHNCERLTNLYSARLIYDVGQKLMTVKSNKVNGYIDGAKKRLDEIALLTANKDLKTVNVESVKLSDQKKGAYVPTGFETVDYWLNDLEPQRVTLVTGESFAGKTTVVRGFIVNAIDKHHEVLWIMGENEIKDEVRRLYQCVIGKRKDYYNNVLENKRMVKIPKPEVTNALNKWSDGKLKIIHKAEARLKNHHEMFEIIENELKVNHHKLVVIDNLMSVLSAASFEKNEAQADFMQTCCDMAKVYNTHIIIVLHPRKKSGFKMDHKQCSNDEISGSGDVPNKADNIMWAIKPSEEERESGIDGWLKVTKNKRWGTTGIIPLKFDRDTESLCELKDGKAMLNTYNIKIEKSLVINEQFVIGDEPF